MAGRRNGDLLIKLFKFLFEFPLGRLDPAHDLHSFQLHGGRFFLQLFLNRLIELGVILFTERLAVQQWDGYKTGAGSLQSKACLLYTSISFRPFWRLSAPC